MDETQPLLHDADLDVDRLEEPDKAVSDDGHGHAHSDPNIVDFDAEGDAENPLDWAPAYKWGVVALLAFMAFTVTFTCISVVPVANRIVADLDGGQGRKSASVLLVTIWELGEAAGPLLIAPLSELYGRWPVMNGANVLFLGATLLAASSGSTRLFIAARALTGLAVTSNVLNPAIVGDMFVSHERGAAMSLIMLAPMIGGAVGPAISGAIAQSLGWRRVVWMSAVLAAIAEALFLTLFRETYKVAILRRKAARLREQTGNRALRTVFDEDDDDDDDVDPSNDGTTKSWRRTWRWKSSRWSRFGKSILRPGLVFAGSGVLQALSLYGSLLFSYFYVMSTSLPDILEGIYGLSPALTGSSFICFSIGSGLSVLVCNRLLDRIYIRLRDRNQGVEHPEYRLPLAIVGGFTLPLVVAMYGWMAQVRAPLPLLLLTLGLLGMTMLLGFLPLMAFVVDAFRLYAASAMTVVIVMRCLTATFLPLATEPLVRELGYGWGFTVLGAVSMALAPIPVLIFKYGLKWRQRSSYTKGE